MNKQLGWQPGGIGGGGSDPNLVNRVTALENTLLKIYYYAQITSTGGQISKPQGATILLDQWANGEDALVCAIQNGKPTFEASQTYVNTFDINGNFTLSGALPSNPAALIYVFEIKRIDFDTYVNLDYVIQLVEIDLPTLHLDQTTPQTISNGQPIQDTLTASELVATDASKKLQSLAVATYPNLTELSYVKGVSGAIQAQFTGKQATLVSGGNIKTVGGKSLLGSTDIPVSNIVWHGVYDNTHSYIINDGVSYLGSSYICKLASTGFIPTNTTYWDLLAAMGNPGVSGISGSLTTPFTSQTSVTVTHNFNGYPAVQVIDDSNLVLIPLTITHTSVNAFTVTFAVSTSGNIIATLGGVATTVVTKTGNYTLTASDNLVLCNAALTITLPETTGLQGKIYHIKHITTNGIEVLVNTTDSKTIDGESTKIIIAKWTTLTVFTDGSNWFII
jgi:hypothetical protein